MQTRPEQRCILVAKLILGGVGDAPTRAYRLEDFILPEEVTHPRDGEG